MQREKLYKTATILYATVAILICFCLLCVTCSAKHAEAHFQYVTALSNSELWTYDLGLETVPQYGTPTNSPYVFNPFVRNAYVVDSDGNSANVVPISLEYDYYGYFLTTDNPSRVMNATARITTDSLLFDGAINTIEFELCVPCTSTYEEQFDNLSLWFNVNGQNLVPSRISVQKYRWRAVNIVGAPVTTDTFYTYSYSVYYDTPIQVNTNSVIAMSMPVCPYDFTGATVPVGIVFGYNSLSLEYYDTFEEAQNQQILEALEKYPYKVEADEYIRENDEIRDAMQEIVDIEEDFYSDVVLDDGFSQDVPISDGSPDDVATQVSTLGNAFAFVWKPWVITLVITGISLATISYALFGGS